MSDTGELRRWIREQLDRGCLEQDLMDSMLTSGWPEDVAAQALSVTANPDGFPSPQVKDKTHITIDGHTMKVVVTLKHPEVAVFSNFLTPQECEELCEAATPRLERSLVVANDTGGSQVNDARTSAGMFFKLGESELISRIEKRIATLLNWPVERGEGLQILKYTPGAEYRPHFDYFDPSKPGTKHILQRGGQRVGTMVIYLREPDGGGATTFPDAGLEVAALQGNAVFFGYNTPHKSTGSLHGGAAVVAGEKWVATKWLRQRTFV